MARNRFGMVAAAVGAMALGVIGGPFAGSAQGQMRMGMGFGHGMPGMDSISPAEVEQFGKMLSLNQAQSNAIKDLHQAYQAEVDAANKVFQEKSEKLNEEFRDTQDFSVWSDMPAAVEKLQTRKNDLEKSFLTDVKDLLTPDQAAKWPELERTHRRTKSLPAGFLAGESIDLVKLVGEMKLSKEPDAVAQSLDRYEADMDQALVERDAKREELQGQMPGFGGRGGGGGPGGFDFQKMQETLTEMRKAGIKVRDLNDRYSAMIASSLPDQERDDFLNKFKLAKFPQIYREPYALKALTAASGFKDLDSGQQSSVSDLLTQYRRDSGAAADRCAKAQADAEKDGGGDQMGGWMRFGQDQGKDDSELAQARRAKRKLDTDTLDKLKGILNSDQVDRLPERDNNFQFGGPGGR